MSKITNNFFPTRLIFAGKENGPLALVRTLTAAADTNIEVEAVFAALDQAKLACPGQSVRAVLESNGHPVSSLTYKPDFGVVKPLEVMSTKAD